MCLIRALSIEVPVAQLVECVTHLQSLICGHVLDVTPLSLIPCPVISKSHVNKAMKRPKKVRKKDLFDYLHYCY